MDPNEKPFQLNVVNLLGTFLIFISLTIAVWNYDGFQFQFSLEAMLAFIAAFIAIIPSYLNNGLPFTVRHIINIHYAAIAGLLLISGVFWLFVDVWIDNPFLRGLFITSSLFATYWSFIHLIPSTFVRKQHIIVSALITLSIVTLFQWNLWVFILGSHLLILSLVYHGLAPATSRPTISSTNAAWTIIAYGLLNLIILLGLGGFFLTWGYTIFQAFSGGNYFQSDKSLPYLEILSRLTFAIFTGAITFGVSLLWTEKKSVLMDWLVWGGIIWVLGLLYIQGTFLRYPLILILGFFLLIFSSFPTRFSLKNHRCPYAILASAITFTLALRLYTFHLTAPIQGAYVLLMDVTVVGAVWLFTYFFGIRLIRRTLEESAQESSKEPSESH
jgi:hypothetical protein